MTTCVTVCAVHDYSGNCGDTHNYSCTCVLHTTNRVPVCTVHDYSCLIIANHGRKGELTCKSSSLNYTCTHIPAYTHTQTHTQ